MKRVILSITGTIAGLIALLSFKTHSPITTDTAIPSAGLGTTSGSTATTPTGAGGSTSSAASTPAHAKAAPTTPASATVTPSTKSYIGSAITTRYGVIQVKATVKSKKIINVSFVKLTAFDGHSQQINSYAAPQLLQETLTAQSANVDTISGASYTSDGYRRSLQSALDQAGI